MRGLLLDTNAYTAFRRAEPEAIAILRLCETVVLSPVVIGELTAGFMGGSRRDENLANLAGMLASPRVHIVSIDGETGNTYGRIVDALRRAGRPIPTNDTWIAASALQHGLPLFTYDAHFKAVPGLVSGHDPAQLLPLPRTP